MTNQIRDGYDPSWADAIFELHNKTEMKRKSKEQVNQAFLSSHSVATYWNMDRLIGFGRVVSDGQMYSSIFDVVVDPEFQRQGVGRKIVERLISKVSFTTIHLTSTLGSELFYERLGFRRHKTAMALYPSSTTSNAYLYPAGYSISMEPCHTWERNGFEVSTEKARLDHDLIHSFLTSSYWAKGIPKTTVIRSISGSICFGIFHAERQVGFARIVSDRATFAYLADVFVIEEYRGNGLSKWLMECILSHPELQGLRRWLLGTRDAHGLYRQFGFESLSTPERFMQINRPNIYQER